MKPLTWETAKNEGALEALNEINKWRIIGETLPNLLSYSEFLNKKIEEIKKKYK